MQLKPCKAHGCALYGVYVHINLGFEESAKFSGRRGDEWPKRSFAAWGSEGMDADRNPASGMNYLQQSWFKDKPHLGCRRQRDMYK